jgi:hypothetical protein
MAYYSKEQNVSENESFSVLRRGGPLEELISISGQPMSVNYSMKIFKLILCYDAHGLALLHLIYTSFCILLSGIYTHHHNFYCTFFSVISHSQGLVSGVYIAVVILEYVRQQAEVIQNYNNENACNSEEGEARYRKYKRLKLGDAQAYDRSSD